MISKFLIFLFFPDPQCFCSILPSPITWIKGGEKGCPSAVHGDGAPAKEYCIGNDNEFPWWSRCCGWKWNPDLGEDSCLPGNNLQGVLT